MIDRIVPQDSPLPELRALRKHRDRGLLTEGEYMRLFRELDSQTGQPCADCGKRPAVIRRGARILCSDCVLIIEVPS